MCVFVHVQAGRHLRMVSRKCRAGARRGDGDIIKDGFIADPERKIETQN